MGSKGGTTQQSTASSSPPPQVLAEYQGLVDRATNVANQPYQPYQGEMVAPLTGQTLTGLGGISQYAGAAQPYLQGAAGMTMGASGAVNPEQFEGMGSLAPYMNPYTQSVVGATQAELNNQNQQQAQFLNSANISSGAFGGDRAGIGQSILANQQALAEAPTIAGLNQANYNQAMSNWQNQQGVNLAAQQANQARAMQGAAQIGQIGETAQQAGLQGAQAQVQAGTIPQTEQQQIDQAAMNLYGTGQAYPFTTTGWLGNIVEGTGGLSGGTSTTTSPGPNALSQGLGAATSGIGLLGSLMSLSDVRAKENVEPIGKTYDGQNIYRYNFKGDPRTQIGLLAQEEAYHDPGSVQRVGMGDLLGIDYEGATDEAAERGHFQSGGAPMGQGQGAGGISPDMALMWSGDPGARMGMGSFGLMGGMNPHFDPGFATVPLRPSGIAPGRQGFQVGGGLPPGVTQVGDSYITSAPGQPVNPQAGVAEALFGAESAGSKNAYTGIDLGQIGAIGGGEWLPPATGAQLPDFQNLQNSPQFGSAEASLAAIPGGGYSGGLYNYTPGKTPVQNPPAAPAAQPPQAAPAGAPAPTGLRSVPVLQETLGGVESPIGSEIVPDTAATPFAFGRASGGSVMNGRPGFQDGGFYTPTTGIGRNATWHPPVAPVPPAIAIQRHLQGQARARAAVQHGLTRPTHIVRTVAPDPVTGDLHDMHRPVSLPMSHSIGGQPLDPGDRPPVTGGHGPGGPPDPYGIGFPYGDVPGRPFDEPPTGSQPRLTGPGAPEEIVPPTRPGGGVTFEGAAPEAAGPSRAVAPRTPPLEGTVEGGPGTGVGFPRTSISPWDIVRGGAGALARRIPGVGTALQMVTPSDPLAGPTGVELPRSLGRRPSGPSGPPIQAPPPQSHVIDLGTWEGEGGAPAPSAPEAGPGPTDEDISRWQGEGGRYTGGRVGYQGGGGADDLLSGLNLDRTFGGLSDRDFGGSGGSYGGLSDADWNAMASEIPPSATAQVPAGGGGGFPHGVVTSLMGGPPITAADFSGHYAPTTGNARGATYVPGAGGISPNARAQAPEHPAITIARHIMRSRGRGQGQAQAPGPMDPSIIARQRAYNAWVPPGEDYLGGENTPSRTNWPTLDPSVLPTVGYQGGGGVMGASPLQNAGGYTPQGYGMSGQTSQGEGLGSFATSKAASGFGDLFGGGGRAGFQGGGDVDPFLAAIQASIGGGGGGGRGPGPPQPPQAPTAPSGAAGQTPGQALGQLGDAVKKFKGVQTTPTGQDSSVASGSDLMPATLPDSTASDAMTAMDWGFQTGGGVGLGSLRPTFQDGGDAASLDQALAADAAPAAPVAQRGPPTGGGTAPNLTYFGDRAGYAGTISKLESNMGKSYVGDDRSSFGPFQLHMGGISEKYPNPGLGDVFRQQTGLDPRDPSTVDAQSKFVADYTAKHGWGAWSTKAQADKIAGGDLPAAGAQPAQATTESYGGGFQIPPSPQQQQQQGPPTLGSELRRDPFGYMMTVGAGMMASRSPWLGVGIGEGLEAGNKYLQAQQGLEREWNLNQAQINNLSAEAREHGADADLKANQVNLSRMWTKIIIDRMRQRGMVAPEGQTGAPGTIAGGVGTLPALGAQPGAAPAAGAPGADAAPAAPAGAAPATGAPAVPAGGMGGADYTKDPDYIEGSRLVTQGTQDKGMFKGTPLEGDADAAIARGQQLIEGAKNRAAPGLEEQKSLSTEAAKTFSDELKKVDDTAEPRAQALERTERMMGLMKSWTPGAYAADKAGLIAKMQDAGLDSWVPDKYKNYADSYQQMEKNAKANVMDMVKQMPGQPRVAEIDAFAKAAAEGTKTPAANAAILAQGAGILDWQNQYAKDLANANASGQLSPRNLAKWKQDWLASHPVDQYMNARLKAFGYQGQRIPKDDRQKVDGQVYMNDRGQQGIWHADRKAFELMPDAF